MRALVAVLLTATALAATGCGAPAHRPGDPVTLRFQSLAWQRDAVRASRDIVAEWNASHPKVRVEYVQGTWDSVHDQLTTAFEGGTAPDVIHYESPQLPDFAAKDSLLPLDRLVPAGLRRDITDQAWDSARGGDGRLYGVPFLRESQVVIANRRLLAQAGIAVPTVDRPWGWAEFAAAAQRLTRDDNGDGRPETYGTAIPLKSPANRILNLSLGFGGSYFETRGGRGTVRFGPAETQVPQRIHRMVHADHSADPAALGMSTAEALPGFLAGRYAMLPAAIWFRQQMSEKAPPDFEWVVLPPLRGLTQEQGAGAQTLSIAAESAHPKEAMAFISHFLSPTNQVRLALGDWLLPTSRQAATSPRLADPATGWDVATASDRVLRNAPYQRVRGYEEWRSKIANPAFQEYFADRIGLDELGRRLTEDGTEILDRYQR